MDCDILVDFCEPRVLAMLRGARIKASAAKPKARKAIVAMVRRLPVWSIECCATEHYVQNGITGHGIKFRFQCLKRDAK